MPLADACPNADVFDGFVADRLDEAATRRFDAHLDRCRACRALLLQLARSQFDAVTRSLGEVAEGAPLPARVDDETHLPRIGDLIGERYRVDDYLGGGGMGNVFLGRDVRLRRTVALKFLAPAYAGHPLARARFEREARAASALDHPNIGTIFDVEAWHADGLVTVMAYYDGETLRERLRRTGPLSGEETTRIGRALASALAAAHRAGIIHRDLKPANVMLTREGAVKLLDFGLAKLIGGDDSEPKLTGPGAVVGTPGYMAPEQLRAKRVDARADLWGLGAMLYEMLAGDPPFGRGAFTIVATRAIKEEPAPLPATTPPALAKLVAKLLRKAADERPRSAEEVLAALEPAAWSASDSEPSLEIPRRSRWPLVAGACSLLALMTLWFWLSSRPSMVQGSGRLRLVSGTPGTRWFLDGRAVAEATPTLALDGVTPGAHTVRVDAQGYLAREVPLCVSPGQTLELDVPLTPR